MVAVCVDVDTKSTTIVETRLATKLTLSGDTLLTREAAVSTSSAIENVCLHVDTDIGTLGQSSLTGDPTRTRATDLTFCTLAITRATVFAVIL